MDAEELMKELENARCALENCGTENIEVYMLPACIKALKDYAKEKGVVMADEEQNLYVFGMRIKEFTL